MNDDLRSGESQGRLRRFAEHKGPNTIWKENKHHRAHLMKYSTPIDCDDTEVSPNLVTSQFSNKFDQAPSRPFPIPVQHSISSTFQQENSIPIDIRMMIVIVVGVTTKLMDGWMDEK